MRWHHPGPCLEWTTSLDMASSGRQYMVAWVLDSGAWVSLYFLNWRWLKSLLEERIPGHHLASIYARAKKEGERLLGAWVSPLIGARFSFLFCRGGKGEGARGWPAKGFPSGARTTPCRHDWSCTLDAGWIQVAVDLAGDWTTEKWTSFKKILDTKPRLLIINFESK